MVDLSICDPIVSLRNLDELRSATLENLKFAPDEARVETLRVATKCAFTAAMHRWLLMCVLLLTFLLSPHAEVRAQPAVSGIPSAQTRVALSVAELEFVRKAKPIVVGLAGNTPPLHAFNAQSGAVDGIIGDYLAVIGERTGLKFAYKDLTTFQQLINAAERSEVDVLPLYALDPARLPRFSLTRAYITVPIAYIARRGLTDVSPTNEFGGYRVAVIRGTASDAYIKRVMPNTKLQPYEDSVSALKAVSTSGADVFVGPLPLAIYQIDKNLLLNLDLRGELDVDFGAYRMAINARDPLLVSIIEKGLATITADEATAIRSKWSSAQSLLKPVDSVATLTTAERSWVASHRDLRIAYDGEFAPFSFSSKGGVMSGLAADYLKLAEQKVGLRVESARASKWADALSAVRAGNANLLVASARNDERRAYLTFVGPYASVPTALIARLDDRELVAIDDLALEKVAVIRTHFLIPELQRRYPGMKIIEVDNQHEALDRVATNEARAALGNLNVIDPILQQHFLGELRVANTVPGGDSELYFAVPNEQPELARVLRKALDGITPQETAALRQKWLSVSYQPGVAWRTILQVGLPLAFAALAILFVILWWNRKLKREVALRTNAEAQTAEALKATRLMSEAKSRFLAVMSHEVRGPVSGIVGTADAMLRRGELAGQQKNILLIRDSGEHLIRMLTQVLDYSKAEAGQFTPLPEWVSLSALIEHSVNPFRFAAEQKNLAIRISTNGPLADEHHVDGLRLRQVVTNLFSNAIKFTEKGSIEISLNAEPFANGAQRLKIRVQDTGPGVPPDERAKLFQPYGQGELGRRRADSTGLGLTISKEIVERLGGTLQLVVDDVTANKNAPVVGACFEVVITVPARTVARSAADVRRQTSGAHVVATHVQAATEARTAPSGSEANADVAYQGSKIRLLLADDDLLNLSLHREVIENVGFIVDTATNGQEALALWSRHHHAIVFSDGSMPIMSGKDFVKAVRADQTPGLVQPWIILLTSYSSALDQDEYRRAGIDDFIEKPLLPRDLQEALARKTAAGR
jgi:two-component system, NarL family, sensor histidine kinase EvgS